MNKGKEVIKQFLRPYWHRMRGIQFSDTSIWPLISLGMGQKDMVVAEIGVFKAKSSEAMLRKWNVKRFYAIDLWKPYNEYNAKDLMVDNSDAVFLEAKQRLDQFSRVTILKQTSISASEKLPDGILDFCFIDANHSYEYVVNDINAWLPKIKKGGILSGHDYFHEPVRKAVMDTMGNSKMNIHERGSHGDLPTCWFVYC